MQIWIWYGLRQLLVDSFSKQSIHKRNLLEHTWPVILLFKYITYRAVTIWEIFWNLHNKLKNTILIGTHPDKNYTIPDWKQKRHYFAIKSWIRSAVVMRLWRPLGGSASFVVFAKILTFVPPGWGANSSQSCRSCSFSDRKQRCWTVLSELQNSLKELSTID